MRIRRAECDVYLERLAELMERYGVELDDPSPQADLVLHEDDDRRLSFRLSGILPHGTRRNAARLDVREELAPIGDELYQTTRYAYELIDPARGYRRAFHLHDADWFERELMVVVHEHCERPIGDPDCDHYAGEPLKDGYAGIARLMAISIAEPPDCRDLECLDPA